MMENALHLGHAPNQWNPKMKPFICDKPKHLKLSNEKVMTVHILDLVKTSAHLDYLKLRLTKTAVEQKTILFVGTKKGYGPVLSKMAKACKGYYVNEKWLGGMLTNWKTINTSRKNLLKFEVLIKEKRLENMPKKEKARAYKVKNKLQRLFGGIRYMMRRPDLVIVFGQLKDKKALQECQKLNIPSISITDSNCNPMASDMIIPGNDDSMAGLQIIFNTIVQSIQRGFLIVEEKNKPIVYKKIYHKFPPLPPYKRGKKKKGKYKKGTYKKGTNPRNPKKPRNPQKPRNPKKRTTSSQSQR